MNQRILKIIKFLKEIEKYKTIEREIFISTLKRKESDAEHAWHSAMILFLLEKELKESIDILKAFKMVLIHDIIEIYAGDTFAFDKEGKKSKKDREEKAAEKLFSQLPDDLRKELYELWSEYEEGITPESKIIKAIDKIQPILSNLCSEGKSWKLKNVTYKDVDDYVRGFTEKNKVIKEIYEELLREARERKII